MLKSHLFFWEDGYNFDLIEKKYICSLKNMLLKKKILQSKS